MLSRTRRTPWYAPPRMEQPPRQSFEPAGAGASSSDDRRHDRRRRARRLGVRQSRPPARIAGVCVGIPAGVFAVYRRYRGYFT